MSYYYQPELGAKAEADFYKLACKKYKFVKKSDRQQDINHVDFICKFNANPLSHEKKIEVKSMKGFSKKHPKQFEWLWMEFKNVTGKNGWLYGKADLIAFELENCFLVVERKSLVSFCEKNCNLASLADKPENAKYTGYNRNNRKDLTSLVLTSDVIKNCKYSIWEK
jgi:hypothetical protein